MGKAVRLIPVLLISEWYQTLHTSEKSKMDTVCEGLSSAEVKAIIMKPLLARRR